jgi:sugar phosphate isomerase/epimerase
MAEPGFRLGASIWGFYFDTSTETWPELADAVHVVLGIDRTFGVEVWASKALDAPPATDVEIDALATACEDAAFVTVHIRGVYWNWNPTNLRNETDFAHGVGAETLVLHPICLGLLKPEDRLDVPEILRLADYAAARDVRLAVENMPDSMCILDRILDEIGDSPENTNLGICIDTGHAYMSHDAGREPVCNYLERYAGQLVHVHLHDNHGESDEHLVPGEGSIDWPRALRTLDEAGFDGTAVLEVHAAEVSLTEGIRQGLALLVPLM